MEAKLLSTDRPIAIYYSFLSDVESITDQDANTKVVNFKSGKGWNLINTTIGTIDLKENSGIENGQTTYTNNLNASCPGHDEGTPVDINTISGRKSLIRIDYKSGLKKLIGNMNVAPRLLIDASSNITTSRKLKSEWKSAKPNYWLS